MKKKISSKLVYKLKNKLKNLIIEYFNKLNIPINYYKDRVVIKLEYFLLPLTLLENKDKFHLTSLKYYNKIFSKKK